MKNSFYIALIALASIMFYSCSGSGRNTATDSTAQIEVKKEAIDTADQRLARNLSLFCSHQIIAGKVASTKASNQKVKKLGKQTVELYTKLSTSLDPILIRYNIKFSVATTENSKAKIQKLSAIKEASFDHEYLLQMLKQHNIIIHEINATKNIQCILLKMFVGSNQVAIIKQAYAISDLKDKTP